MKNFELKVFGDFLYELSLKGKESRMRSRFVALIEGQLQLIQNERDILLKDFAQKDEQGEIVTKEDSEGKAFVVLDEPMVYNLEVSKLMNEDFVIEVKDDNKDMIKTVQEAVLNVDKEFSGFEAESYNRLCEILEAVTFE